MPYADPDKRRQVSAMARDDGELASERPSPS